MINSRLRTSLCLDAMMLSTQSNFTTRGLKTRLSHHTTSTMPQVAHMQYSHFKLRSQTTLMQKTWLPANSNLLIQRAANVRVKPAPRAKAPKKQLTSTNLSSAFAKSSLHQQRAPKTKKVQTRISLTVIQSSQVFSNSLWEVIATV